MNLDTQGWANLIQGALILVTITGIWVALSNGRKDRKTAMMLAVTDRRSADDRADEDRHAADKRAENDRRYAREQVQQNFRLQQGLRLTQLLHEGLPDNPAKQTAWSVEVQTILYSLGENALPVTWSAYARSLVAETGLREQDPAMVESPKDEVAKFLRQTAQELACGSCFHTH